MAFAKETKKKLHVHNRYLKHYRSKVSLFNLKIPSLDLFMVSNATKKRTLLTNGLKEE